MNRRYDSLLKSTVVWRDFDVTTSLGLIYDCRGRLDTRGTTANDVWIDVWIVLTVLTKKYEMSFLQLHDISVIVIFICPYLGTFMKDFCRHNIYLHVIGNISERGRDRTQFGLLAV